jgi:hypothetical protein
MGEVNEKFIKATGKVATNEDLEMGQDIEVTLSVIEISDKDRYDGTVDRYYKAKLFTPEGGWADKVSVKQEAKSPSQRLREVLFVYFTSVLSGSPNDFNAYYEKVMDKKIQEVKDKLPE